MKNYINNRLLAFFVLILFVSLMLILGFSCKKVEPKTVEIGNFLPSLDSIEFTAWNASQSFKDSLIVLGLRKNK